MIKYIFLLLPFLSFGQFYKYSTIYGGVSTYSTIAPIETYQYVNNQLIETTPEDDSNFRYFVGVRKISRFSWEKKPRFYYDGNETNASVFRSPVDKFEYLLQYEQIKQFGREYNNHDIWFRYIGNHTTTKIQSSNNGYIDLNFKSFDTRFKYDLRNFRVSVGVVLRYHPIYSLNPFKIDFPNYDDFEAVSSELGYIKEFWFIDQNNNNHLYRLEQSFFRWILNGDTVAQTTSQFLQHYATIPAQYNKERLSELGNQYTLSGVIGLSYYKHLDNAFVLIYGNYLFKSFKLTEYGHENVDYDFGIIGNLKLTKRFSVYADINYLKYFDKKNHTLNLGINLIII